MRKMAGIIFCFCFLYFGTGNCKAQTAEAADKKVNILFVLDCSSSMIHCWDDVKKNILSAMEERIGKPELSEFAFILYKSGSKIDGITHKEFMSFSDAKKLLNTLSPKGGTEAKEPVYQALWAAFYEITWKTKEDGCRWIILIGNGEDNGRGTANIDSAPQNLTMELIIKESDQNRILIFCYDCAEEKLTTFNDLSLAIVGKKPYILAKTGMTGKGPQNIGDLFSPSNDIWEKFYLKIETRKK